MKNIAIVGSGPAGLFCADRLAGYADVTIYETGFPIRERVCLETGCKCEICHVLEGEGGAGGFSDGKNTYSTVRGTQMEKVFEGDRDGWFGYIDDAIVKHAGEGVWYDPLIETPEAFKGSPLEFGSYHLRHVGSDGIRKFIRGFTSDLAFRGVEILFNRKAGIKFIKDKERLRATGVIVKDNGSSLVFGHDIVVIAAGLQGIPWIEYIMKATGSPMKSGPAGFGIRLETDAKALEYLHKQFYDYKIVLKHAPGITLRSFCCNQNGYVINERHTDLNVVNVNGHSFLDPTRRSKSSNMAIIAKISPDGVADTQDGVRSLAKEICEVAGGSAYQPLADFMQRGMRFNRSFMTNHQSKYARISEIIPKPLLEAFRQFIRELDIIVPVISSTSVVYAPEIKYYGRRVNVTNEWKNRDVDNLYIIGSGSGYLDSFVAAALSGIIAAENIRKEVL